MHKTVLSTAQFLEQLSADALSPKHEIYPTERSKLLFFSKKSTEGVSYRDNKTQGAERRKGGKEKEGAAEIIKPKEKRSEAFTFTVSPVETRGDLRLYRLEEVHIRVFLFSPATRWTSDSQSNKDRFKREEGKPNAGTPACSHMAVKQKSFQSEKS